MRCIQQDGKELGKGAKVAECTVNAKKKEGCWGYSQRQEEGRLLSVQSTTREGKVNY